MTSKNPEIAVLQTQVEGLTKTVDGIDHKVDTLLDRFETTAGSFATRTQVDKMLSEIKQEFNGKIKDARKFNWLTHSMTAILTAFLIAIAYWIIAEVVKK